MKWNKKEEQILIDTYRISPLEKLCHKLNRSRDSVRNKARSMGIFKEVDDDIFKPTILLTTAYTEKALLSKYDKSFSDIEHEFENSTEFSPYYQVDETGEQSVILLRNFTSILDLPKKQYTASRQPDGQPYLWVKLPKMKVDKIKIIPLSDIHYGHSNCDINRLTEFVNYVKENENVYTFLNGDIIENSSKYSVASGVYEQSSTPTDQISEIIELLSPISDRILWSIAGNHEDRSFNHLGIDVGKFIAERLNIPYFNEPVYVDIMWNKHVWRIFDQHGSSGSLTTGGKINTASKPITWNEFTNFYIMGHVHDKASKEILIIKRNVTDFKLEFKKQYVIICSSFLKYFGTYGARKCYPPSTRGFISIKLYKNGDYHLGD